ncbi:MULTISPECIES: hypothetical protein [unclassified Fusobacterium]|uniref:hypothetical protein n=1 Tax=unclassified Fusobacterium TaxID=2648384 RepID=UPI002634FC31|nr:hypothetical protein [Fusobacterium sp.]
MKLKNLLIGTFTILSLIGCSGSDESTVKKYLPGNYTIVHKKDSEIGFGYLKELDIKHLKGNEYRISCVGNDSTSGYINGPSKTIVKTPDIFDFEISSITLNQKSDSVSKYYIKGFVTNVIENGTTYSFANKGVNYTGSIILTIGKNEVQALVAGNSIPAVRKK